jgi:outer membrane protein assembly factor BamA
VATPVATDTSRPDTRMWAVLPQVGYSPDSGPLVGAKYTERNRGNYGVTLDFDATASLTRKQSLSIAVGTPRLGHDRFLTLFEGQFVLDPQRDFFGLGNSDADRGALSVHEYQRAQGIFAFGWRPTPTLALDASFGIRYVSIRKGTRDDDKPFTTERFRGLPGVRGGYANPIGLGLVWTTRDDVIQPREGWRLILKVAHTNRALLSDFQFTRLVGDLSYLFPLFGGAHVLGLRLNGGVLFGPRRDIPFWELEELGGDDTLRGFLPRRFSGTSRVLFNAEYRFKLSEFDFFDLWRVRVDGVAFGDAGRVFVSNTELHRTFHVGRAVVARNKSDFRYSYGTGLLFQLAQALVARVNLGFSEEETGIVYLEFGHTF